MESVFIRLQDINLSGSKLHCCSFKKHIYLLNLLPYFIRLTFIPWCDFHTSQSFGWGHRRSGSPWNVATMFLFRPKLPLRTSNIKIKYHLYVFNLKFSTISLGFRRLPSSSAGPPHPDARPTRRGVLKTAAVRHNRDHRDDTHGTRGTHGTQWHWPTEIIMII